MNYQNLSITRQLESALFLTDGGLETDLIFNKGIDLPCFASFDLLSTDWGRQVLGDYYRDYLALASRHGTGFILESPTWRANPDWGEKLGYDLLSIAKVNREAIIFLKKIRRETLASVQQPMLISGNIGPRGDGYSPSERMTSHQACDYHSYQTKVLADAGVDLLSAFTINYLDEALGIVLCCQESGLPVVISFTLETDGNLPSGESLATAITVIDRQTANYPLYYMINCAHPTHFETCLDVDESWKLRIRGIRANASKCSHAELDSAEHLDDGNPVELGADYLRLKRLLPGLRVFGGCCGTDLRHITSVAEVCLA